MSVCLCLNVPPGTGFFHIVFIWATRCFVALFATFIVNRMHCGISFSISFSCIQFSIQSLPLKTAPKRKLTKGKRRKSALKKKKVQNHPNIFEK